MTQVLVTGARGVVGKFLVPRLDGAGFRVHALSRRTADANAAVWHRGDLTEPGWSRSLPQVEVVFHLAPLWLLPPVLRDLEQLGVRRIVAFGSTSRHTKAASDSPLERSVAEKLALAEDLLQDSAGFADWTVLRPTLIYGGGHDRNISDIARFILRFGFFPLAVGASGLRQPVHADDLAVACISLMNAAGASARVLDVGGGEKLSYREMVRRIFHAMGRPARILPMPKRLLRTMVVAASRTGRFRHVDPAMIDRMSKDMVADNGSAAALFGYDPRPFHPVPEDFGLRS